MKREIKFRGKDETLKKWLYGDLLQYNDGSVCIGERSKTFTDDGYQSPFYQTFLGIDEETIGQFTGRHDKNGKEIYSGDLLKDQDGVLYEVWYSEDTAAFMSEMINPSNDMVDILGAYDTERCFEVIGNIYDNHELLEE